MSYFFSLLCASSFCSCSTGDGIKMTMSAGGATVDMTSVQVHPTGLVHPSEPDAKVKFLAAEALRGVGGLLLTNKGERFVDELGTRDYVTGEMWKAKAGPYRLVLNGKGSNEILWHWYVLFASLLVACACVWRSHFRPSLALILNAHCYLLCLLSPLCVSSCTASTTSAADCQSTPKEQIIPTHPRRVCDVPCSCISALLPFVFPLCVL